MKKYTAIEIDCPKIAEIVSMLAPTLKGLDYEKDLHQHFLVFDYPKKGMFALVSPKTFKDAFDHVTDGLTVKLKNFVKK